MPGVHVRTELEAAVELTAAYEATQLEGSLLQKLEEDVARIFDESIHSDFELVCGRSKILTHTCILKARTKSFYRKLEAIPNRSINHKAYDEIYSFISDAYTECNIAIQEGDIISYLDSHLNLTTNTIYSYKSYSKSPASTAGNKEETIEPDVYLTPKCTTPYAEKGSVLKNVSSSPSIELTKEYYALVPIESHLDKELKEQDQLSTAFQSIITAQSAGPSKATLHPKPKSLSLKSSHTSKFNVHSNNRDELIKNQFTENNSTLIIKQTENDSSTTIQNTQEPERRTNSEDNVCNQDSSKTVSEKNLDVTYSPDSLITDDPSSSSDYLSVAFSSPCVSTSGGVLQLNVCKNISKMANVFTSSDSGLENTESDLTVQHNNGVSDIDITPAIRKSSKEEKQRQNEEIVTFESSSLSSETGSWESVFPPRIGAKELCVAFINKERQTSSINGANPEVSTKELPSHNREQFSLSLVQRSPFKAASCFIDAASLIDDEEMRLQPVTDDPRRDAVTNAIPAPSHPVPCHTTKNEISPNDWSESHDDSLEQLDQKDPDSLKKDLSPTIFDMTPITEDSLCPNAFEEAAVAEGAKTLNPPNAKEVLPVTPKTDCFSIKPNFSTSTPNNSIMSIGAFRLKNNDSEDGDSDSTLASQDGVKSYRRNQYYMENSSLASGAFENNPIVTGAASLPEEEIKNVKEKSPKPHNVSTWVVDMSSSPKSEKDSSCTEHKRPHNRNCEILRNESMFNSSQELNCKSRSSVDSDSSERSSHKFYIDLTSLPDPSPPKDEYNSQSVNEKKNIFSIYIDIGEKSTVKEMPARLSSSLNVKKTADSPKSSPQLKVKNKNSLKSSKNTSLENLYKNKIDPSNSSISQKTAQVTNSFDSPKTSSRANESTLNNFEEYEALCSNSDISVSEIIALRERRTKTKPPELKSDLEVVNEEISDQRYNTKSKSVFMTTDAKIGKDSEKGLDVFVRLSDLDKPKRHLESCYEETVTDIRMTRSIPDTKWCEGQISSRSIEVISSFHSENTLSLNRLFPHLKNEFSSSMPGSLSSRTRSPMRRTTSSNGEIEEHSEVSEVSSGQSSYCRSVVGNSTTDDSQTYSLIGNCQSRLGEDLLRMFLEEIAPDVIVEVSGRQFKAHKCILSSRCQYFAAILSGDWVKNAGNVIVLPPFSADVVHFTLCHIYSGVSTIPDSVSMVELATLADMLGLEGLKEAIMFTLKFKYCHNFHKPCQVCVCGVLECFCLSSAYGLDDLYLKCLRWMTKYFQKIWPTKAFATLSKDLQDKCYYQHIVNLSTDTIIDTICGSAMTMAALPQTRWAEAVARLCRALLAAAVYFCATHLSAVVRLSADVPPAFPSPALHALEKTIADAIERASPEEACMSYAFLSHTVKESKSHSTRPDLLTSGELTTKSSLLSAYAHEWRLLCERTIVRSAPRAINTQAYRDLPQELRKRLRELGCIPYGSPFTSSTTSIHEKVTKTSKSTKTHSRNNLDIEQVRANFVPYSRKPIAPGTRTLPKTNPPKIRTTKAQEERARFNLSQVSQSQETGKAPVRRFENTKPRYLESRVQKENRRKVATNKMVKLSSTESSRNSSPVPRRGPGMSRDSLATSSSRPHTAEPSTDSLSESHKYATYTKSKYVPTHSARQAIPIRSKIPVYQHPARIDASQRKPTPARQVTNCNRVSNSLMMATKSSSAKVVPKISKEAPKSTTKSRNTKTRDPNPPVAPVMERSGTFLKDEPTFGDKTTNIDMFQ